MFEEFTLVIQLKGILATVDLSQSSPITKDTITHIHANKLNLKYFT